MIKYITTTLLLLSSLFSVVNAAEPTEYQEVTGQTFIEKENIDSDFEIHYFFNYGCPNCYALEQMLDVYFEHIENIDFKYRPINVQPAWEEYAKAYYVAENLEIPFDEYHKKLFNAVHVEKKRLLTKKELEKWFLSEYDISTGDYHSAYNSYTITYKLKQNEKLADNFEMTGTPTLIILTKDGKTFQLSPKIHNGLLKMVEAFVLLTLSK